MQAATSNGSALIQVQCPALLPPTSPACNAGNRSLSAVVPAWQLGAWGPCSATCGGGVRVRSAACLSPHQALPLPASSCSQFYGDLPAGLLSQACNSQPCLPRAWDLGAWGQCNGDSPSGYSSRQVQCVDASGRDLGTQACASASVSASINSSAAGSILVPASSSACFKLPVGAALCRYPGMVGVEPCSGQGTCTYSGEWERQSLAECMPTL